MGTLSADGALAAEIPYTLDDGVQRANETYGPNNIRRRPTGTQGA
jgi:hypothetical protein